VGGVTNIQSKQAGVLWYKS